MSSLLRTIGEIWENAEALCALVPFARVFTGRVPQTELYQFPYVSILSTVGSRTGRSDKARYSSGPVSFHIWVDDNALETGLTIANAITDAYADTCWIIGDTATILDVLDEGEPSAYQTQLPGIKAWEIVKLLTVHISRERVDSDVCCPADEPDDLGSEAPECPESSSSS